jgi:hypothetical protein
MMEGFGCDGLKSTAGVEAGAGVGTGMFPKLLYNPRIFSEISFGRAPISRR